MLKDYEYVVDLFKNLSERVGQKVKNLFDRIPDGVHKVSSTTRKFAEILENDNTSWTYMSDQGVKLVTMMQDVNQVSAGDEEISLFAKKEEVKNLEVGKPLTIALFSEVQFILENNHTGQRFGEYEHNEVALYRVNEKEYKAFLLETTSLYEHKITATGTFIYDQQTKNLKPVEKELEK